MADSTSSSMSAHLCLMAWNEPIGRPNCTRSLAYCTAVSSTFWAPPTCSAARATAARSSTRSRVAQPSPSVPMSVAGVPASSILACLRVWSMVARFVRVTAGIGRGRPRRCDTPASVRAATRSRLATLPSSTNILVPVIVAAVAGLGGGGLDAALVPLAVGLGEGEGGDRLAGGDAGEVLLLGGVVAGVQQGAGGQDDGGEVGGAQQRPAHLLEDHGELDEGEALAAELLGDDQALEAELVGHLAPDGVVVALVGVHEAADLGLGRLALEELAGDAAELFLLLGEGEVHGPVV